MKTVVMMRGPVSRTKIFRSQISFLTIKTAIKHIRTQSCWKDQRKVSEVFFVTLSPRFEKRFKVDIHNVWICKLIFKSKRTDLM